MTSITDIANRAMDILAEAPITSIDEDSRVSRWLKRNFYTERDSLLEYADWNFAIKRVLLPADSEAPAFGWSYQYTLPGDRIRVLPLTQDGTFEGTPIPHVVEGGKILTNLSGPIKLRYIWRNENYAIYPATFQSALSARIARKAAHWITGKSSYVQVAQSIYQEAMEEAWLSDAIQGTWPRAADDEWLQAR